MKKSLYIILFESMLCQKIFEKQNKRKKRKFLRSDHIKTGQLIFNRYQLPSFYKPRFSDGGNTSIMAWMFAIRFGKGSVFWKDLKYCISLSSVLHVDNSSDMLRK